MARNTSIPIYKDAEDMARGIIDDFNSNTELVNTDLLDLSMAGEGMIGTLFPVLDCGDNDNNRITRNILLQNQSFCNQYMNMLCKYMHDCGWDIVNNRSRSEYDDKHLKQDEFIRIVKSFITLTDHNKCSLCGIDKDLQQKYIMSCLIGLGKKIFAEENISSASSL